ncbi:MAG: erythromycin esterase family protein [Ilumatobacteraceae bacterium]
MKGTAIIGTVHHRAELIEALRSSAGRLTGSRHELDAIVEAAAQHRVVLIGEATHGTHEFHRMRMDITRRLITEAGFTVVAAEADWPDAHRVDRYVRGLGDDHDALASLGDFARFPAWMWRHSDMLDFVAWLRAHNDSRAWGDRPVRFVGLDLYSLRSSIAAVIEYLDRVDPDEAAAARKRYACFDHVGAQGQAYGLAIATRAVLPCEDEVVTQLVRLRAMADQLARRDGDSALDEYFSAEQNAVVIRDAEEYYQQMFRADVSAWNLRDRHMAATLTAVMEHLDSRRGSHPHPDVKAVVWAHNSHVGDARATGMATRGELNLGELVRRRDDRDAFVIGFTSYDGTVAAAPDWDGPVRKRALRPGLPGSLEELLHHVGRDGEPDLWFDCRDHRVRAALGDLRPQRAVGVVYRPQTERASHYLTTRVVDQFDLLIHLDRTSAIEPLETGEHWNRADTPDTYPTGV